MKDLEKKLKFFILDPKMPSFPELGQNKIFPPNVFSATFICLLHLIGRLD